MMTHSSTHLPTSRRGAWWSFLVSGCLAAALSITGCATPSASSPRTVSGENLELAPPAEIPEATASDFSTALAHFGMALRHEIRSETTAALRAYAEAIEADPDNDTLYQVASQRLIENDREEEAVNLMNALLERDPENVAALRWLAHLHLKNNRIDEALPLLKRAVDLHSPRESVYLIPMQIELSRGNLQEAIDLARLGREHAESPVKLTRALIEMLSMAATRADDLRSSLDMNDEVTTLLDRAVGDFPEESIFPLMRAKRHIEAGRPADALEDYRKADAREGLTHEIRTQLLVHMIQSLGGNAQAIRDAREFLEGLSNPDGLPLYLLGELLEVSRQPREALDVYKRAAKADPGDPAIRRKLALLHYQNDQPGRAASQLDAALASRPDDPDLRMLAGQLKLASEQFQDALRHFQHLWILHRQGEDVGNVAELEARRAMALMALDRGEDAVDPLETATRANQEFLELVWAHQIRLSIQDRETDPEEASRRVRLLLDVLFDLSDRLPDDPGVETTIGTTYNFREEHREAVSAFRRAADLAGDQENPSLWLTPNFFFEWGNALERSGKIDQAVATFNKVLIMEPNHHQTLNYLAYMWAERSENLDKALDYVQRALELNPGNGAYLDTLGWIHYQQGNFEPALRELEKAAQAEPMEPVIIEHMGDVMLKLDRPVEAAGYYRIALELGARDRESIVRESLSRAEAAISDQLLRN